MSIRIMSKVFETDLPSSEKFVLLAMADYASDSGDSIFPSVQTLTKKTSLSERTIQNCIQSLLDKKYLQLVAPGGGRNNTNLYKIRCSSFTFYEKGATVTEKGATTALKGATTAPDPSLTIIETSYIQHSKAEPIREECDMDGITESMNLGYGLKKKKSYLTEEERTVGEVFSNIAGVKVPVSVTKRDYGEYTVTWWKPIKEMLRQVDNDVARASQLIEQAIEKQRKAGLPVGMPKSILNSYMGELSMNSKRMAKDADGNWREV